MRRSCSSRTSEATASTSGTFPKLRRAFSITCRMLADPPDVLRQASAFAETDCQPPSIPSGMESHQRVMTTRSVAEALAVSVETIRRYAERGVLEPVRFVPGGPLRFRVEDVEALLD